jgi:tripartite-type tricarboxylate transporter receptor subunit TctC
VRRILSGLFAAALCGTVFAQAFPSKPIRILVPFPAGGTTDVVARLVGQRVSEQVGQPVLVESRPGAGGTIAAAEVARSAPDGYTLLIHNITFPIASVAAALKQDLIAGRIHLGGDQLSTSLADIKAGKLKALATSATRRIPELPDLPTVRELGYPMLEAEGWNGFFAPAKTPRDVLERLNREFASAAKHPELAKRLREMAAEPVGSSGAEQEAIFKRQMDQFRPIIKEMRIEG